MLILMMGPPGSGKTTFANVLAESIKYNVSTNKTNKMTVETITRDNSGTKGEYERKLKASTTDILIVDRQHASTKTRESSMKLTGHDDYIVVMMHGLELPDQYTSDKSTKELIRGICVDRISKREDHPNLNTKNGDNLAKMLVTKYFNSYETPESDDNCIGVVEQTIDEADFDSQREVIESTCDYVVELIVNTM